jgi:predicted nucleic acid-binding protein
VAGLVIDASAGVALCFPDEQSAYTDALLNTLNTTIVVAPELWASVERAEQALLYLNSLPVQLVRPVSYNRLFHLARENNLTIYDAAYLDLALRESCYLATLDSALQRAATAAEVRLFQL